MRVRISDLHVRTREVELPERCSECGRAVVVDKLVTSKLMYLFQAKGDEEGTDFFMEDADPTLYACECGEVLVCGYERVTRARANVPLGIGTSFGKLTILQRKERATGRETGGL